MSTRSRIVRQTLVAGICAIVLASAGPAVSAGGSLGRLDAELSSYRSALAGGPERYADLAASFADIARSSRGSVATWAQLVEADCLERADRPQVASFIWKQLESAQPAIATYCRYRLGGADALAGAHNPVGAFAPDLLLKAGLAETDPDRAAANFTRALALSPAGPVAEQALYELATRAQSDRGEAASRYLRAFPDGPHATAVSRALDPHAMSLLEREDLAGTMLDSGDYGPAIGLLIGDPDPMARYRLGRAYWKLGHTSAALTELAKAQSLDPGLQSRVQLTLGQMAMKKRQWEDAIPHLRSASLQSGPIGLDALVALTHVYREENRDSAAAAVDQQVIRSYPDSDAAADAQWRALWTAFEAGHEAQARLWAQSLEHRESQLGIASEFWLGRMEQDAGQNRAALATYADVSRRADRAPAAGYYGWRARMRSNALTGRAADPGFAMTDGPVAVRPLDLAGLLPREDRSGLRLESGLALPDASSWPDDLRVLAYLGLVPADRLPAGRARMVVAAADADYADAIRWAEQAAQRGTAYSKLAASPLGFWSALEPAARSQGLDPLFLAALIKQESFFDPNSRSWAGAIGLAQLMPFTASWVGRQLGGSGSLDDPSWNLRCGAWYLAYTGRIFHHQGILEAAAYNAGVAAVKHWLEDYGSDPEVFIERIPYFETRHYVKKVYGYYWTYRSLYRP